MEPLLLAKILICLTVPLVIAAILARIVRLPQYTRRVALVMYVAVLCAVALYPWSNAMRLGIDLSGGTILVYQVDPKSVTPEFDINKMVTALNKRINPAGVLDTTIRGLGRDRVEIIIPRAAPQEVERCKRILTTVGSLEFRILANGRDHALLIEQGKKTFPGPVVNDGRTVARWVPIAPKSDIEPHGDVAIQVDPKTGRRYVLVYHDPFNVTGEYLTGARDAQDERGRLAVGFHFNNQGGALFGSLTERNLPMEDGFARRLAIILNGEVYSAPNLQARITTEGIITGEFSRQEVSDLIAVLNAGSLPGELVTTPASELTIGPTLGRDTIRSGLLAMAVATAVVLLFMAVYYHLAGIIADIAVILNVLIVVGVMAWLHATWTLAGLAGLALTVGMAVDANVLIYERLREEQARGRSLRMTIEYAFDRAFAPIFDSNITTLLAGVVLYAIGSEQVKGFAVTLIIGLLANLFTAVLVCRLIFDIIERNNWVKRITMLSIFGRPNFDFVGKRYICVWGSAILIALGFFSLYLRGPSMLDIDFTGGTLAAVHFSKQTDSAAVRSLAMKALNDESASVEELQLHDEPAGRRFLIRTTVQNPDEVKKRIAEGFGNQLTSAEMTNTPFQDIPKASEAPKPAPNDAKAPDAKAADPKAEAAKAESKPSDAQKAADAKKAAAAPDKAAAPKAEAEPSVTTRTFAGGIRTDLQFAIPMPLDSVQTAIEATMAAQKIPDPSIRFNLVGLGKPMEQTGSDGKPQAGNEWEKMQLSTDLDRAALEKLLPALKARLADQSMFERLENFGSQVAREMQTAAIIAVALSMLVMIGYLWIRFQNVSYGLGAVVALIHDTAVVVGLLAISGWLSRTFIGQALMIEDFKINLPVIAALLTLVGYSVNDTIVVFDRIREVKGKRKDVTWEVINESVNQTLSRTILTSLTVWLVAVILYVMGGVAIHGLAFCLVAGVIVGTYSSIYIASPFLVWLGNAPTTKGSGGRQVVANGTPAGDDANDSARKDSRRKRRVR